MYVGRQIEFFEVTLTKREMFSSRELSLKMVEVVSGAFFENGRNEMNVVLNF
jgi:hypothetical protein